MYNRFQNYEYFNTRSQQQNQTPPTTTTTQPVPLSTLDGYGNPVYTGGFYNYVSNVIGDKVRTGKERCENDSKVTNGDCKSGYCEDYYKGTKLCKQAADKGYAKPTQNCPKGKYRNTDGNCEPCINNGVNSVNDFKVNTCQLEETKQCKTGYTQLKKGGKGWGNNSNHINIGNCLVCDEGYFGGQVNGSWYGDCHKPSTNCDYGHEYKIEGGPITTSDTNATLSGNCNPCNKITSEKGTPANMLKPNSCSIQNDKECNFPYKKNSKGECNVCAPGYKGGVDEECVKIALKLNFAKKTIRFSKGEKTNITDYIKNICNGKDCQTLLRSIEVEPGFEAYLFSETNFKGKKLIIEQNQKLYYGDKRLRRMNDILSIKIIELPQEDVGVTLFSSNNLDFDFDDKTKPYFKVHIKKGIHNQVDLFNIPVVTNGFNSKKSCGSNYCTTKQECQNFCNNYNIKTEEEIKDVKINDCDLRSLYTQKTTTTQTPNQNETVTTSSPPMIPEKILPNKPYGCIKYNDQCIWNKSKQTIKKNSDEVICETLYLNSKEIKSLRVYKGFAVRLSNELYIHGEDELGRMKNNELEAFSAKNIFEGFTTSSTQNTNTNLPSTITTPPPQEITLYEGAYDYETLKRKYFNKGYSIRSIDITEAKLYYECLSGFDKYPISNLTKQAYDIRYECISDNKDNCVTDVKCGIPGKIQPSVRGSGTKTFNCNDKDKTPDQEKICNLLQKDYNCMPELPTTTPPPTTTTQKTCPTFQQLLDINMPKKKENYFTNKFLLDEQMLQDHLLKDHKELNPNTIITYSTPPPPTTTTTTGPEFIGMIEQPSITQPSI